MSDDTARATAEVITAYKGFDADMRCRGFQFAVGVDYTHDGDVKACEAGFHACTYPLDVFNYYAPSTSRFAVVEQSGLLSMQDGDSKVASSRIRVTAEIGLHDLIQAAIEYTFSRTKPINSESPASATGEQGAASATGEQGAASATGDQGAASATGTWGAASATGTRGAAMATGFGGRAMGTDGNALFLVERRDDGSIAAVWSGIVGQGGIKPGAWYTLSGGVPVEVAS